jgi:hypothetical protein
MNTKTIHFANLFAKNTDLSANYTLWNRGFKSNTFDFYDRNGSNIRIKHGVNRDTKLDEFIVTEMKYEYNGCLHGQSVNYGTFNIFDAAIECAEQLISAA